MSTFFLDRNIGRIKFAAILAKKGISVEVHDDHFAQSTPDDFLIAEVSSRGWVMLTLDENTRRNPVEKQAIVVHAARVIYLSPKTDIETLAHQFVAMIYKIEQFIEKHNAPFLASITPPPPKKNVHGKAPVGSIRLLQLHSKQSNGL